MHSVIETGRIDTTTKLKLRQYFFRSFLMKSAKTFFLHANKFYVYSCCYCYYDNGTVILSFEL